MFPLSVDHPEDGASERCLGDAVKVLQSLVPNEGGGVQLAVVESGRGPVHDELMDKEDYKPNIQALYSRVVFTSFILYWI